ncbi:MAG: patatin-like phospholipase family protein [Actinobacteria bacterium]|nr:patatin-like phospholipase family protein [Actinomycetota bacterium]
MASRALVLGGGGITGAAWEVGLIAGLAARGVDLTAADLVLGTSAGALAGAQVTSGLPLAELYQAQCAPSGVAVAAAMGRALMFRYALAVFTPGSAARARKRLGRLARASPPLAEAERQAVVGAWLPSHEWPAQRLLITAVDADTGVWGTFDASSGVSLIEAVSASCAVPGVWPPVRLGGRRWMDGGMRSAANADLAAGSERVVVLAPIWKGLRVMPAALFQCQDLARAGSAVVLVAPNAESAAAMGRNVLDSAGRPAAARAGYAQAEVALPEVAALWSGERLPEAIRPER